MLTLRPPAPVWPLTRAPAVSRVWSGHFLSCPLAVPVRWDEAGDHVSYACPSLPEHVLPWQGGSFPPCAAATPGAHWPLRQLERLGGLLPLAPTHPQGTGRLPSGGGVVLNWWAWSCSSGPGGAPGAGGPAPLPRPCPDPAGRVEHVTPEPGCLGSSPCSALPVVGLGPGS